ncbi:unnamed protein product [Candidula unifasciata]|uniref:G-protein coupled receptors family 1 profile domain-containing protein n=1 Tax=Candidula unifasciata TaxID=100452 RepID=A0A8S3YU25_9EUPU|nr:unnamed protein product [Candidula unifasciata]
MNNSTDGEYPSLRATADILDKASVCFSLITGIPGNLFIFLTVSSFPATVARFHFQLLAAMDSISLCLLASIRIIDWYELVVINSRYVSVIWKVYFNIAYFTSVYANWVLVYIAMERLIALRYPSQVSIYLTVPRAKANAVVTALLMASFCGIVTVKMHYFGIAWLVIYTTFYTAFPLLIVFIIIWLLLGTMEEQRRDRKLREKEREKHNHHHHHHHKDGYKTPLSAVTPTGAALHSPIGGLTPTGHHTPTMTKSISGLSKHSAYAVAIKHDKHVPGVTTSVSRQSMTLTFTGNPRKSNATSELHHEPPEIQAKRAKEKKEIESCYTFMMLALSVTFVLLTIPYTAVEYIYVTSERVITDIFDEKQAQMYLIIVIALTFMFVEHSCNFYVFFLCSRRFRQQFMRVVFRRSPADDGSKEHEQTKSFV